MARTEHLSSNKYSMPYAHEISIPDGLVYFTTFSPIFTSPSLNPVPIGPSSLSMMVTDKQHSDRSQYSFDASPHEHNFGNALPNCGVVSHSDTLTQGLDGSESCVMHNAPPVTMSLSDSSSLPPSGLSRNSSSFKRNPMRPNPPALQIHNNLENGAYATDQSFGSPSVKLKIPATPADHPFYMNGSGADSMTSFSPSSSTSGELDSAEGISPETETVNTSPLGNADRTEALRDATMSGGDRTERKKRNSRRMWTHSLEKYIFTPHEIATLGTPHRRTIYSASLEAHIDRLHSQLLGVGLYPVHFDDLEVYRGLNCKIAKGMVAGLQHDYIQVRTRLLEIERATNNAREMAAIRANHGILEVQNDDRGSVD